MRARWALFAVAAASAVGVSTCAVFQRPDALIFSHKRHAGEAECADCHGDMAQVEDMTVSHLPKESTCLDCHDDRSKDCGMCHTNPAAPAPAARVRLGSVVFNHRNHSARTDNDCARCHSKVIDSAGPRHSTRPEMLDECMSCHRKEFRQIACVKCHDKLSERKEKPFELFSHRGEFLEKHPIVAKGDLVVCNHCHRDAFCNECHSRMAPLRPSVLRSDAVDRLLVHRGDFLTVHALEARLDPKRCLTCHTPDRCTSCHEERGVAARGEVGFGPHPPGWMVKGSSTFHGPAARRDIVTCAACHDRGAESSCIACHKVGGSGGSPHPPGWRSRQDPMRGHACVLCHR